VEDAFEGFRQKITFIMSFLIFAFYERGDWYTVLVSTARKKYSIGTKI
jgi:hypothetical protein